MPGSPTSGSPLPDAPTARAPAPPTPAPPTPAPLTWRHGLAIGVLVALVLFQYEIVRPVVESVFLGDHGAARLPWAWLAVAATAGLVAAGYNGPSARYPLLRLLAVNAVGSGLLLLGLMQVWQAGGALAPGASFGLYVVKDVHIVLLIETFWMYANTACPPARARQVFGLFCAAGSVGSALGSRATRLLLEGGWTVQGVLWVAFATLGLLAVAALALEWRRVRAGAPRVVARSPAEAREAAAPWWTGFAEVRRHGLVRWVLVLVVVTQLVTNLLDYRFNRVLETALSDREARAAAASLVYEFISYGALATQLLTGPLLAWLGLRRTVLMLPWVVGGATLALVLAPRLLTAGVAKAVNKAIDYGWFRATKELLYLPLPAATRLRGKAVVDILGYRGAKALASLVVLAIAGGAVEVGVDGALVALVGVWVLAAMRALHHHRRAAAGAPGA